MSNLACMPDADIGIFSYRVYSAVHAGVIEQGIVYKLVFNRKCRKTREMQCFYETIFLLYRAGLSSPC